MNYKLIIIASCLLLMIACGKKTDDTPKEQIAQVNSAPLIHTGKVLETMNSGGYTYVEIEENGEKIWAAGQETTIKKGEQVSFQDGMIMPDFESKTLNRKFSKIYFVKSLIRGNANVANNDPTVASAHTVVQKSVEGVSVSKAAGGYTIAECYAQKKTLSGKNVKVQGKIVKFSANIMGKNWIHLQDGTGESGSTNDLTITTSKKFEKGQVVLVTGTLQTDKHIGPGYDYPVILEEPVIEVK